MVEAAPNTEKLDEYLDSARAKLAAEVLRKLSLVAPPKERARTTNPGRGVNGGYLVTLAVCRLNADRSGFPQDVQVRSNQPVRADNEPRAEPLPFAISPGKAHHHDRLACGFGDPFHRLRCVRARRWFVFGQTNREQSHQRQRGRE